MRTILCDDMTCCTIADAAKRLGVTRRTIEGWVRDGRLRAFTVGAGRRWVVLADVEAQIRPVQVKARKRRQPAAVSKAADRWDEQALADFKR